MKRTKENTGLTMLLAALTLLATMALHASLFLASATLLTACSSEDTNTTSPATNDSEIRFDVGVWNMMEGTRATFYDDAQLRSEGFICTAYNAGTTTEYISPVQVNWDGGSSQWVWSDGKRYWPAEGSLDFVAYKPNVTSYASVPSYNGTAPSFTATLPMTAAEQDGITELILAFTPNQSKAANAAGVSLNFLHPFTKIIMKLSSTQTNIHIDKIIFKSIKKVGTYTHNSGWALSEDAAVNFEASLDGDYEANADLGTYLMIPQNWAGAIEIQATWTDWGEPFLHHLYSTVPTNWAAGYSYSYTFTITQFDLRVDTVKFTEQW